MLHNPSRSDLMPYVWISTYLKNPWLKPGYARRGVEGGGLLGKIKRSLLNFRPSDCSPRRAISLRDLPPSTPRCSTQGNFHEIFSLTRRSAPQHKRLKQFLVLHRKYHLVVTVLSALKSNHRCIFLHKVTKTLKGSLFLQGSLPEFTW